MAAALHTDHVNLLIFRYLQEAGFENSAHAFHRDWHRRSKTLPFDPEALPFAHVVQRDELVSVIQNGLHHDMLQARVRKSERRFKWGDIDARESAERQQHLRQNGSASRPSSNHRRKGRPPATRRPDDFPMPAPKRPRRSEDREAQVNGDGDAMEVDVASADGEQEGAPVSPTVASEVEQVEVMERYDSMDVLVGPDGKTDPVLSTLSWRIDSPQAIVQEALWNPNPDHNGRSLLLLVGNELCRYYDIPDSVATAEKLTHFDGGDALNLGAGSAVTAVSWRPDGKGATFAVDGSRRLPSGSQVPEQTLVEQQLDGMNTALQPGPPTLEPAGLIVSIQYSPDAKFIMALRTNTRFSMVQIWMAAHTNSDSSTIPAREPIAWTTFEHPVHDLSWTGERSFVVCGDNGWAASYQIDLDKTGISAGTALNRGLIPCNPSILEDAATFDKVRFDRRHQIAVFASSEGRKFLLSRVTQSSESKFTAIKEILLSGDQKLEVLAFQSSKKPDDDAALTADLNAPTLLATAFDDGSCAVYSVAQNADSGVTCSEVAKVFLSEAPASAISWSPSGDHLAVANEDVVQIWRADDLRGRNGSVHAPRAVMTWRSQIEMDGQQTGPQSESPTQPGLSWSADGENLALASAQQVSVIRFTPPLGEDIRGNEVSNGHYGP